MGATVSARINTRSIVTIAAINGANSVAWTRPISTPLSSIDCRVYRSLARFAPRSALGRYFTPTNWCMGVCRRGRRYNNVITSACPSACPFINSERPVGSSLQWQLSACYTALSCYSSKWYIDVATVWGCLSLWLHLLLFSPVLSSPAFTAISLVRKLVSFYKKRVKCYLWFLAMQQDILCSDVRKYIFFWKFVPFRQKKQILKLFTPTTLWATPYQYRPRPSR